MEKIVEIKNVSKTYEGDVPCRALKEVSLSISKGEFISIMGHSGSGKSTLLHILGGLDKPSQGEVVIDGISIYELDENKRAVFRREYVGFVFQQFHLIPVLNALENVMLPLSFAKDKGAEEKALAFLGRLGMADKQSNLPTQLSGGQCQRVAIARALVNSPFIILADEPTGNLDTATGRQIMELLRSLNKEGHTIVVVTHDSECAEYANKIVEIKDGEVFSVRKKR